MATARSRATNKTKYHRSIIWLWPPVAPRRNWSIAWPATPADSRGNSLPQALLIYRPASSARRRGRSVGQPAFLGLSRFVGYDLALRRCQDPAGLRRRRAGKHRGLLVLRL